MDGDTWIGLSDTRLEGKAGCGLTAPGWTSPTGSLLVESQQPDNANGGEDCAHTRINGQRMKWNDRPCTEERAFVCATRLC